MEIMFEFPIKNYKSGEYSGMGKRKITGQWIGSGRHFKSKLILDLHFLRTDCKFCLHWN